MPFEVFVTQFLASLCPVCHLSVCGPCVLYPYTHSDADTLWTKDRETQKDQVKRATQFLNDLWEYAVEQVRDTVTWLHARQRKALVR